MITSNNLDTVIIIVILVLAFILVGFLIVYIAKIIISAKNRKKFKGIYNIENLPKNIKVKKTKKEDDNYFILRFPYWCHSKKDGTADLRIKNNWIVWDNSTLYISNFLLECEKPYVLLEFVNQLRSKGITIDLCDEEKIKYSELKKKKEIYNKNMDIQEIIERYEERPTDFEKFCAELFERMGYYTEITLQSNDGGYDLILLRDNEKTIVECKCYSQTNKVGRPAIQKLVGANNIALADKMVFITTSEFSSYAVTYANEVGVELIDGYKLLQLLKEYLFLEEQVKEINIEESFLEISDMRPYVPKDIFDNYFPD